MCACVPRADDLDGDPLAGLPVHTKLDLARRAHSNRLAELVGEGLPVRQHRHVAALPLPLRRHRGATIARRSPTTTILAVSGNLSCNLVKTTVELSHYI
eukprot:COSAG02_NODE_2360_length_9063_cov_19.715529_9_plen_99_part_00